MTNDSLERVCGLMKLSRQSVAHICLARDARSEYFARFADRVKRRGLTKTTRDSSVTRTALVDELREAGRAVEIDWRADPFDMAEELKVFSTWLSAREAARWNAVLCDASQGDCTAKDFVATVQSNLCIHTPKWSLVEWMGESDSIIVFLVRTAEIAALQSALTLSGMGTLERVSSKREDVRSPKKRNAQSTAFTWQNLLRELGSANVHGVLAQMVLDPSVRKRVAENMSLVPSRERPVALRLVAIFDGDESAEVTLSIELQVLKYLALGQMEERVLAGAANAASAHLGTADRARLVAAIRFPRKPRKARVAFAQLRSVQRELLKGLVHKELTRKTIPELLSAIDASAVVGDEETCALLHALRSHTSSLVVAHTRATLSSLEKRST
jgi:hypothetical protein